MDFLRDLGELFSAQQTLTSIVVVILLIGITYVFYKIITSQNSGRDIIKGLKTKVEIVGEALLGGANILEAITTATAAAAEGINFFVRLGIHLILALFGISIGFGFFDQVKQAVDTTRYLIHYDGQYPGLVVIDCLKQWAEAFFAILLAIGIPIINWSFLLIYEDVFWGFWTGEIKFHELSAAAQGMGVITAVHIATVFYLSSISYDSLRDFYEVEVKEKNFKDGDMINYVKKYGGGYEDVLKTLLTKHDEASLERRIAIEQLYTKIIDNKNVYDSKHGDLDTRLAAAKELTTLNKQLKDYLEDYKLNVMEVTT